jgi:hypothetical protein
VIKNIRSNKIHFCLRFDRISIFSDLGAIYLICKIRRCPALKYAAEYMCNSLRTRFLNIVCGQSMISFDKLHSVDRSTSIIRRTISSKTEIMGRETELKYSEGVIVSVSSNQSKTTTVKTFMVTTML